MTTYEFQGKTHRIYLEGEIIHGPPELNDIVLTRDGKQMIYEGSWRALDMLEEDRIVLVAILKGESTKQVEVMFIVHSDPDKERVKEKILIWNQNVEKV